MTRFASLIGVLLALPATAETTTIEVPQGSGVFPTIGQINCLEEIGGSYCAAMWACGDESGVLWGDMTNNNGRRALGVESPVARRRSCVVKVDGLAEAVWFTAHTPRGLGGQQVGLSPVPNPKAPVVRRLIDPTVSEGSLLRWMTDERGLDLAAVRADACKHLNEHATDEQRSSCEGFAVRTASVALLVNATPFAQCAVDWMLEYLTDVRPQNEPEGGYQADALFRNHGYRALWLTHSFGEDIYNNWQKCFEPPWRPHDSAESRERCCDLYREEAAKDGLNFD